MSSMLTPKAFHTIMFRDASIARWMDDSKDLTHLLPHVERIRFVFGYSKHLISQYTLRLHCMMT
jgi:hypothetical protein